MPSLIAIEIGNKMNQEFIRKLKRGALQLGTIISLPSPEIAEIYSWAGFDWLFLELEHSVLSLKDAQTMLQTTSQIPFVIRVPLIDEVWIKKALDIGPAGLIIPQIQTADDVERVIELCKYPPQGKRSVGIARAQGYGEKFHEYVSNANKNTAVIIMIEHKNAVKNIDDIIKVRGIDCLFIGPYDLSTSMNKAGQTTDPDVQNAISKVKERAMQAKIPLGIFGATVEAVKPYIQMGYKLIAIGVDTMLLSKSAKEILVKCKDIEQDDG
jgi:2-keto-3-deoxy-L-rhamnonate aldolase RhmA